MMALAIAGCESIGKESNPVRSSNTEPMSFEERETSEIDLVSLIDPERRRTQLPGLDCQQRDALPRDRNEQRKAFADDLSCAIRAFQTYYLTYPEFQESLKSKHMKIGGGNDERSEAALNSLTLAVRRNQIQDRIMLRSDALCADFQRRLGLQLSVQNDSSFVSWLQNNQRRMVSGVGSLFLGGDAVFALTAVARAAGSGNYINDEEQLEIAVTIISTQGINIARRNKRQEINAKRFFKRVEEEPMTGPDMNATFAPLMEKTSLTIGDGLPEGNLLPLRELQKTVGFVNIGAYTLENALSDVISYHNACSVGAGLASVANALRAAEIE